METKVIVVVTPREKELYDTICELGGWVSRKDIAKHQNKHVLSPHDFDLLDRLEDKELIQKNYYSSSDTSLKGTFMYRVLEGDVAHD